MIIEYDFDNECPRCFGNGYLQHDFKVYDLHPDPYCSICDLCRGYGIVELPELELEK